MHAPSHTCSGFGPSCALAHLGQGPAAGMREGVRTDSCCCHGGTSGGGDRGVGARLVLAGGSGGGTAAVASDVVMVVVVSRWGLHRS